MKSGWLATASAAFICATALVNASRVPHAEEIRYDEAGNLIWNEENEAETIPSLGRPDFSTSGVQRIQAAVFPPQHNNYAAASVEEKLSKIFDSVHDALSWSKLDMDAIEHKIEDVLDSAKDQAAKWIQTGNVMVEGIEFERLVHPAFPNYALRLNTQMEQGSFCDDVVQHSGYLDISETKHLWFIFFESRSSPKKDPVVLWLNGGPGCSSSTGLLFELGPCAIADEGKTTTRNPHSWNNHANLLFLDQPVDVGYSYSDNDQVNNSPAAAEDVYAFLQLFFTKFSQYSHLPFSVTGESYGGTYIPSIASTIFKNNHQLSLSRYSDPQLAPKHINLESVAIGNGLSNPEIQFPSVPEYGCDPDNKYHLWESDSSTCVSLRQKAKTCLSLIQTCHKFNSRFTCTPAALYCWGQLYGPAQQTGKNLYDVRKDCDREKDGPLCYKQLEWVETLFNRKDIKAQLGVPQSVNFQSCNMNVNQGFMLQGDSMHNPSDLLPELIDAGIRVLIYAGEADFMCNYMGNLEWMQALETSYKSEFNNGTMKEWSFDGRPAGRYRQAGNGFGSVAYLQVYEAGHMVPYDQPQVAAEMIERWLTNKPLA